MGSLIKNDALDFPNVSGVYIIDCEAELARQQMPDEVLSPEEQARRMVIRAEEQAAAVIAAAHRDADAIRESAQQEGYQAGHEEWDAEKQALQQQFAEIEAEVQQQVAEHWQSIEPELLALAVDVAKKIVRHEVDEHQEYILSAIKAGLYQLRDKRELKLRVSPRDYEFAKEHKDDIRHSFDGLQSLELIEDRRIEPGGCLIESASGHLDARLESQFTEVQKALTEAADNG